MKNTFKKLICAALCVVMIAATAAVPVLAVDTHSHSEVKALPVVLLEDAGGETPADDGRCDHNWVNKSSAEGYNCQLGTCWIHYKECTKCGAQQQIAFREFDGMNLGQHQWVESTYRSDCPDNPTVEKRCSICHDTKITEGGHKWVKDGPEIPGTYCTDNASQKYRCSSCGATKTENNGSRGSHTFETVETEPTCTEPGYRLSRCKTCGYETNRTVYKNPLGHKWVNDSGDHTVGRTCSVCGLTTSGTSHTWSDWKSDETSHWVECTQCKTKSSLGSHVYVGGRCDICGKTKSGGSSCQHEWKITGRFGVLNHYEQCGLCGETRQISCREANKTKPRSYCTDPLYCQCGNKMQDGQKNHNFGTWICHDDTHEHKCLNIGCGYGTVEHHNIVIVGGVAKCSVCSFIDKTVSVPHSHSYGAWTAANGGCVKRCTDPTCGDVVVTAHTLSAADCAGNATCTRCGATVKTTANSANHVGGTEIRNARAAAVGVAGYTGDTWCLTCGKMVSQGTAIEALKSDHVHTYNVTKHDATGHWQECQCGDRKATARHTGGQATCATQAVCSVCGESYGELNASRHVGGTEILNARAAEVGVAGYTGDTHCLGCGALMTRGQEIPALAESHRHTYTLRFDSTAHWQECQCGDKKDIVEHTYENGFCSVCGDDEPVKVEAHVHTFSAGWDCDSVSHWHTCATCGSKADVVGHVFTDGRCGDCGMTYSRYEGLAHVEQDRKLAQEQLTSGDSVITKFGDVKNDWYTLDVQRVNNYGLMKGTGDGFGVNKTTSRIEIMTIIARINNVDGADGSDWTATQQAAEDWAVGNGIADAGSRTADVSREELVLMLWRNAGKATVGTDLSRFTDASALTGDSVEAMKWAVRENIITGRESSDGVLSIDPAASASRAEIAAILTRYIDATAGDTIDIAAIEK